MKANSLSYGVLFTICTRWTDRIIGLLSTIILARLLSPADFGLIAITAIIIGFADTLFNLGTNTILIQKANPTSDDYSTAWSIRLIQTIIATAIVIFFSPLAATYFNTPELENILPIISLVILFGGLENIWIVSFQKNIQFNLEFKFLFTRRLIGFLITVALSFALKNYWALVIGTLATKIIGVILSYIFHKERPKISFAKANDMLRVSFWLLLTSIGAFLNNNLHKAIVGKFHTSETTGQYTLADEIAALPTSELLAPINRVIFPALSNTKDNPSELKRLFLLTQGYQALIAIPAGLGLAAIAPELVPLLLGEKWINAVIFVQLLAIYNVTQAIGTSFGYTLLSKGRNKLVTLDCWLQIISFSIFAYIFESYLIAEDLILTRLAVAGLSLFFVLFLVLKTLTNIKITEVLKNIYRPILAGVSMIMAIAYVYIPSSTLGLIIMIEKIAVGSAVYSISILLLWHIAGKPESAEKEIIQLTKNKTRKLIAKMN